MQTDRHVDPHHPRCNGGIPKTCTGQGGPTAGRQGKRKDPLPLLLTSLPKSSVHSSLQEGKGMEEREEEGRRRRVEEKEAVER